jgi:hypothetical protein
MSAIWCVGLAWALFDLFVLVLFLRAGAMRELRWARRSAGVAIPTAHESARPAGLQSEPPALAPRARSRK